MTVKNPRRRRWKGGPAGLALLGIGLLSWLSLRPPAVFAQGDYVFGTQVQLVLA
nr:hypothetical protein [uncultured Pseudogulbenkiania sp.]